MSKWRTKPRAPTVEEDASDPDRDERLQRAAMAGFMGGRGAANPLQNKWQNKYQTIRHNKMKGNVQDGQSKSTARPNAYQMLGNFYTEMRNPEARANFRQTGTLAYQGRRKFAGDEFFGGDTAGTSQPKAVRDYVEGEKADHSDTDAPDEHKIGDGLVGDLLDREFVTMAKLDPMVRKQLRQKYDHRPFFTSWIMFVNIVILIVTLAAHSIAPIGFSYQLETKQLLRHNLAYETVGYNKTQNFWIGPDYQALIHLGAKYSPCMRSDREFNEKMASDKLTEDNTGCCIRNDLNACWQTTATGCTSSFATFKDGKVCGLDEKYCSDVKYKDNVDWKKNITDWPNCPPASNATIESSDKHMKCEVTARPCCIELQGECVIISQEECEFREGFFHENDTLCSQVSCITDVCGLSGFLFDNQPDQFYRALLPTFMHAGVFHLLISLVFQVTILRDMEKLAGWWRIAIVYMSSGVGGTMLSAILIPYQPEVGASGALYGILAALTVEVIKNWSLYKKPIIELLKLVLFICLLFLAGLLPWIDNFAHIGGFLFGFLTSFVFLPHVNFSDEDRIAKLVTQIVCGVLTLVLLVVLFLIFYTVEGSCTNCSYFNCLPFTDSFCQDATMELRPRLGN